MIFLVLFRHAVASTQIVCEPALRADRRNFLAIISSRTSLHYIATMAQLSSPWALNAAPPDATSLSLQADFFAFTCSRVILSPSLCLAWLLSARHSRLETFEFQLYQRRANCQSFVSLHLISSLETSRDHQRGLCSVVTMTVPCNTWVSPFLCSASLKVTNEVIDSSTALHSLLSFLFNRPFLQHPFRVVHHLYIHLVQHDRRRPT